MVGHSQFGELRGFFWIGGSENSKGLHYSILLRNEDEDDDEVRELNPNEP